MGGLFLAGAVGLGIWANEIAEFEAILRWEKTHLPSGRIFQFALGSRGLHAPQDMKLLQRVYRSLPTSLDERGSIWITQDGDWVVYFAQSPESDQAHSKASTLDDLPQLYCYECTVHSAMKWESLGMGWRALETLIDVLDKKLAHFKAKKAPQKSRRNVYRDPREIIY